MKFTVRRWSETPQGMQAVCKSVEVDDAVWAVLQQWSMDNRQALIDAKALAEAHADGYHPEVRAAGDALMDSHNKMWAGLPMEYRIEGDKSLAVIQHHTLVKDNPCMIPEPAPAAAKLQNPGLMTSEPAKAIA